MMNLLINHIWQSTLFAGAAWLVALLLRNNRPGVRFWAWLGASVKFLIPFTLLVSLGARLEWTPAKTSIVGKATTTPVPIVIRQIASPFIDSPSNASQGRITSFSFTPVVLAVWVIGVGVIATGRFRAWHRLRLLQRAGITLSPEA